MKIQLRYYKYTSVHLKRGDDPSHTGIPVTCLQVHVDSSQSDHVVHFREIILNEVRERDSQEFTDVFNCVEAVLELLPFTQ